MNKNDAVQYSILSPYFLTEVWLNVSATKQCDNETQSGSGIIKYKDTL
jgi:hypothetical protein